MPLDRSDKVRNHFVYRVYDAKGGLLYVGCTSRPTARWNEHRTGSPWWAQQARQFRLSGPYCYRVARAIEKRALSTESPRYGWTPQRHAEVRTRDAWANRRIWQLVADGLDFPVAVDAAYREAHRIFPGARHVTNRPDSRALI